MKKTLTKALAIFLSTLMLFTTSAVFGFAADSAVLVPTIAIEKVSETTTEVVIAVKLETNSFSSLDLTITTADNLVLKTIEAGEQFNALVSNAGTGKISFASTTAVAAPADIAEYTYTKSTADGVVVSDFTVTVDACWVETDGEGEDVFESVTLNNQIPSLHSHVAAGDWNVTVPADCGKEGTQVRYCSECGDVAETEAIAATGDHKNTTTEHLDATCTTDGYTKVICKDCGTCINEIAIPLTGHVDTHEETTPATCTEDGVKKTVCACGEVVKEEIIPATGHVDTHEETTPATCTENGLTKIICACGEVVKEEIIPATGHVDTREETTPATCTENGLKKTICACGEVVKEEIIPSTGHVDTHEETTPATCTEDGLKKTVCACGEVVKEEIIPATGHGETYQDVKLPTCTEDGYNNEICTVCNQIKSEEILQKWGHSNIADHQPATCTEDGHLRIFCTVCQNIEAETVLKAEGHNWLDWEVVKEPTYAANGIERRVCKKCGTDEEREIAKLLAKPTELILSMNEFGMNYKQTARLFTTILPDEAAYSAEIIWESSDESVVTVNEEGEVLAVGVGTATITAKTADGLVEDTCEITVTYSFLQWIIIYLLFGWIWYM